MSKGKVYLGTAQTLASQFKAAILPYCQRVAIVGSVRRTAAHVGDIELLAVPKEIEITNLFGENVYSQETRLDRAVQSPDMENIHSWVYRETGSGPAIKRFYHKHVGISAEIYVVKDDRTWGIQLAVRTGPARFSKYVMRRAREQEMCFKDGFLLHGHPPDVMCSGANCKNIIPLRKEADVFEVLKIQYMSPLTRGEVYGDHE